MALSCGAKCAKGVLIAFNLIFWLSGCALIAFGIFMLIEEEKTALFSLFKVDSEGYADLQYLAFGFIGIGGLVFIVGFFGCCGAMQENKCMLIVYAVFLFIVLVGELAVGIMAVFFRSNTENEVEKNLQQVLKTQYGMDVATTKAIDLAQAKFRCCGIKAPSDYDDSLWKKNKGDGSNYSATCCTLKNAQDSNAYVNPQPINVTQCQSKKPLSLDFRHQEGCMHKLADYIKHESLLFIFVGCGVAVLEIFGIIFSVCLCKEI